MMRWWRSDAIPRGRDLSTVPGGVIARLHGVGFRERGRCEPAFADLARPFITAGRGSGTVQAQMARAWAVDRAWHPGYPLSLSLG